MKDYVVIVKLASEAIALEAESAKEAKAKALSIMIEQYSQSVAYDASYEIAGK